MMDDEKRATRIIYNVRGTHARRFSRCRNVRRIERGYVIYEGSGHGAGEKERVKVAPKLFYNARGKKGGEFIAS